MKYNKQFKIFTKHEMDLINHCYDNDFGIDLKTFHQNFFIETKGNLQKNLDRINHSGRCILNDNKSSQFELVTYRGLVYLLGDQSCYPCSQVVESAYGEEYYFVECWILNSEDGIIGETDIRRSAIIVSMFREVIKIIPDEERFLSYISYLEEKFSGNNWFRQIFSVSHSIKLVKFWNYRQKIEKLYEYGRLYPLDLVIYCLYKGIAINPQKIERYFIRSLTDSTKDIFERSELSDIIENMSSETLEAFLEIGFIKENVDIAILDDEYLADLWDIDIQRRYPTFIGKTYYFYYVRDRVEKFFQNKGFKLNYFNKVGNNLRSFENRLRKEKGFDGVGSYYKEKLLFERLKGDFPELIIISQYSPAWLSPQRFDIFIKECNLALEYNGVQHYVAVDFFGGEEGLRNTRSLDKEKKKKCQENGTLMMTIRYDRDFDESYKNLKNKIIKILSDGATK